MNDVARGLNFPRDSTLTIIRAPERKLENWLDAFYDYTADTPSPELFRKWGGVVCVAAALERRVWGVSLNRELYPSLYTFLVAPPGQGKTLITDTVYSLLSRISDIHLAPTSVSRASLIDALRDARNQVVDFQWGQMIYNSLCVIANELGVLLPAYEGDFMSTLTDIYDCKPYAERKRTKDLDYKIEKPQINLFAATTPSYLSDLLPKGAWNQGFISRVILIYSGHSIKTSLFKKLPRRTELEEKLVNDLAIIAKLNGPFTYSVPFQVAMDEWHSSHGPPTPEHPRLINYNERRTVHRLKLAMICSAARSSSLQVEMQDFYMSGKLLFEAEEFMPDIFKAMAHGGDIDIISEIWHDMVNRLKVGKGITLASLNHAIGVRAPSHTVDRIFKLMTDAEYITEMPTENGVRTFVPKRNPTEEL